MALDPILGFTAADQSTVTHVCTDVSTVYNVPNFRCDGMDLNHRRMNTSIYNIYVCASMNV